MGHDRHISEDTSLQNYKPPEFRSGISHGIRSIYPGKKKLVYSHVQFNLSKQFFNMHVSVVMFDIIVFYNL